MKAMFAIVVCLASCTSPTGECNDCGPCGLVGGPNEEDSIMVPATGVDDAGTATVELARWKQGECAGDNGETYWLHWDGGTIVLEPRSGPGGLDASVVTQDGAAYTWSEPPLQMTSERAGAELVFRFTEEGVTTDVVCSLDAGTVVCELR